MRVALLALALAALLTWGWRQYAAAHRRPWRRPTLWDIEDEAMFV